MTESHIINALTVDFEDWYQGLEIPCKDWYKFEDRIDFIGRKLLRIFADANVKATFFVLGHLAEKHPSLIKEISDSGHEIGTHGYSHQFVYKQTPKLFRDELQRSVNFLRDTTGQEIIGHRAAYFSITKDSLWAIDILQENGIKYDSSIFPINNYRYGIADAPTLPYELIPNENFMEFPISTWTFFGKNLPASGGAYFRIFPYELTKYAFRKINSKGNPFVFYLHPWELDPSHPKISLPYIVTATHYFNLRATERRLNRLLNDFKFSSMKEVLNVG